MRLRLYDSAMHLFAERGYDQTSIDDIAETADVARATVFNYFKRKEEFLDAWTARRQELFRATIIEKRSPFTSARDQLRQSMEVLAAANEDDLHMARALIPIWVRSGKPITEIPRTADIFTEIVTEGVSRGDIRNDVDAELVGNLLRDIYLGTLYRWIGEGPPPPFSLRDHLLTSLDVLLEGLAADRE